MDSTAYGSIAARTLDQIVKQAMQVQSVTMSVTAPLTPGTTIAYLLEAAFSEADTSAVVLPYYNASNPTQPYLGPGNNGSSQNTLRQQSVVLPLKAGAPATTGSQVTPPVIPAAARQYGPAGVRLHATIPAGCSIPPSVRCPTRRSWSESSFAIPSGCCLPSTAWPAHVAHSGKRGGTIAFTLAFALAGGATVEQAFRPSRANASQRTWMRLIRDVLERIRLPDAVVGVFLRVDAAARSEVVQGDILARAWARPRWRKRRSPGSSTRAASW